MALTEIPSELSSTPSIEDNGNATAINIDSNGRVTIDGTIANGLMLDLVNTGTSTDKYSQMRFTAGTALNYIWGANQSSVSWAGANSLNIQSSSGAIGFFTSGSTLRMKIHESSGNIDIPNGNLSFAAGHGIDFSANANAGGMTSETLDGYETGTWTPTLAGYYGSYGMTINQGTRSGYYTKVGNLVTLSIEINSAGVAASGNGDIIVIMGLPFTIGASATVGSHAHSSIASFAGGGWTSINATQLGHLGNGGTSSSAWTWMTGGNVATSGVAIRLTITYRH